MNLCTIDRLRLESHRKAQYKLQKIFEMKPSCGLVVLPTKWRIKVRILRSKMDFFVFCIFHIFLFLYIGSQWPRYGNNSLCIEKQMGKKIWFLYVIWICLKRKGNPIHLDKKDGLKTCQRVSHSQTDHSMASLYTIKAPKNSPARRRGWWSRRFRRWWICLLSSFQW